MHPQFRSGGIRHQTMKNNSKTNFIFILFIIHVKYPLPGNRLRKKKHYSSQRSTIWMEIDGRIKQLFASFLMAWGIKKYSADFVLTPANLLEYKNDRWKTKSLRTSLTLFVTFKDGSTLKFPGSWDNIYFSYWYEVI